MKLKLTWADHLYTLLMQQAVTKDNMELASSAVGAWLGEKANTMSQEDFEELLAQAVEELETFAWDHRAAPAEA